MEFRSTLLAQHVKQSEAKSAMAGGNNEPWAITCESPQARLQTEHALDATLKGLAVRLPDCSLSSIHPV
jgi:hypothetical protein